MSKSRNPTFYLLSLSLNGYLFLCFILDLKKFLLLSTHTNVKLLFLSFQSLLSKTNIIISSDSIQLSEGVESCTALREGTICAVGRILYCFYETCIDSNFLSSA